MADPNMAAPKHSVQDESMGYDGMGEEMDVPDAPDEQVHPTQTNRRVPYGRPDPYESHA